MESQISSLREHCVSQGYQIEEDLVFTDNGVSGTTLVRPGLDALRDKAVAGEVNQILILCPDRLARKYAHQLILVEEFKNWVLRLTLQTEQFQLHPKISYFSNSRSYIRI
ncbi:MAG: recombinase family protein [Bdellovibrionales bacterium]|nr:recombinase family protein [Bdellovibrionales bacterium]